jgi:hypothetical protein
MISARKKANKMRAEIAEESEEDEEDAVEDESTPMEEQAMAYGITRCQRQVTEVTDTNPPAKVTGAKQPTTVAEAKQPAKPATSSDMKEMTSVTLRKKNKKNNKKSGKQPGNAQKGGNKKLRH